MQQPEQLNIIAETDNFYVWHEYPEPRATGQANVVPKEHKESIMDLTPGEYSEAMTLVREVMEKAKTGIDAEGLTVVIPEGQMGGQMLDHMYIQIFPRFEEDEKRRHTGLSSIPTERNERTGNQRHGRYNGLHRSKLPDRNHRTTPRQPEIQGKRNTFSRP